MTSPPALQHGQYYHIYNRGNNRQAIFMEERNYRHFLQLYARYVLPVADTFAYCLLPDHFHFLVRIKTLDTPGIVKPSQGFSNLFNAYAKAINRAYERTGSLFQNPFGRKRVDSDAYFLHLIAYTHRNPQKHAVTYDFRNWIYSSYQTLSSTAPTQLARDVVWEWFDGVEGFRAFHQMEVLHSQVAPFVAAELD